MAQSKSDNRSTLSNAIKDSAQRLGFDLVGISPVEPPKHEQSFAQWLRAGFAGALGYMERTAQLRREPHELVPWALSVISVGMNYYTPSVRPELTSAARGWISRYAWGDDYHDLMRARLDSLLDDVRRLSEGPVQGRSFVDSGPVLERDFAGVAGLGWIGKNTQLISPKRGSWFFLGELFIDLPLAYDRPMRDRCGRCDLCLKACPTSAFVGPYVLDARRCISYLTIELKGAMPRHLRPLVGNHIFGCDICQEVCPYNTKAPATVETAFNPRPGLNAPELLDFLAMTDEEFRRRFRGSPILRAKRRGFLRNVAVALGNIRNPATVPRLSLALHDHELLVRSHVAWALGRIATMPARQALERRLAVEQAGEVREEIHWALGEIAEHSSRKTLS